jgi:DNA primase
MTFLELLQVNVTLKRVAMTNGGEYAGPCPFCGGRDRFRVWPNQSGGRYWCRGCRKHGDAIQWLRDTRGLSFQEACAELGIDPHSRPKTEKPPRRPGEIKPANPLWQKKAGSLLAQAKWNLWKNQDALTWLYGRGLRDETIRTAGLGWNSVDRYEDREAWGLTPQTDEKGKKKNLWLPAGLMIPCYANEQLIRLRIRLPKGELRYYIVPGSDTRPMLFHREHGNFVVVESELDALLIDQETMDLVGTVGLGSVSTKPDEDTDRPLKEARLILNCLDFDKAGAETSWGFWSETYGAKVKRWPVPIGKDPSEAFQEGLNIRTWIEAGLICTSSSLQNEKPMEAVVKPFPKEWLDRFDEMQLERLAIMTIDGRLTDTEAMRLLN